MIESKVARRYAKSLLGLAQERNITARVFADMELLDATCSASRDFVALMRNPIINADKKEAVVKTIFESKMDAASIAFLLIIIRKGRESYLDGIAAEFIRLYKTEQGIVTARVTSAVTLDAAQREAILQMLKKSKGDKVELVEQTDAGLIGGFILRVEDQQHDASVSRKLRQLRNEFDDNLYIKEY